MHIGREETLWTEQPFGKSFCASVASCCLLLTVWVWLQRRREPPLPSLRHAPGRFLPCRCASPRGNAPSLTITHADRPEKVL